MWHLHRPRDRTFRGGSPYLNCLVYNFLGCRKHQHRVDTLGGQHRKRLQQAERLWRRPAQHVWAEDKADTGKLGGNWWCSGTGNGEKTIEPPRKVGAHSHGSGYGIAGMFPPQVLAARV